MAPVDFLAFKEDSLSFPIHLMVPTDHYYQWQRPQRRPGQWRLSFWISLAMVLSVVAHLVLWVLFGNFYMRSPDKIILTEPFRTQRSTFDATMLEDMPNTRVSSTADAQDPSAADSEALIEEAMADFSSVSEEDLADFIVNAEVKMTPAVEQIENVAIDADVTEMSLSAPSAHDRAENDISKVLQGLEKRAMPLDPDHPEIAIGDMLVEAEEASLEDSALEAVGGGGTGDDMIPDGYASIDQVLGMKGRGDPGKPIWVPTDVLFEFNSAELKDDARLSLMKLGALIMQRKESEFLLEGHTDMIGDADYNQALSLNRATAIRNWLLDALRLDSERIKVIGHGKESPLVQGGTPEEQAVNRRVEVTIQPIGTSTLF